MSNQSDSWTESYTNNTNVPYSPEALIRLLSGTKYPKQRMPTPRRGDTILDVGCGSGSALKLFDGLGLRSKGTEVSNAICDATSKGIGKNREDILVGFCDDLPFPSNTFDYVCAWNSCYYMSLGRGKFEDHVNEMARVLSTDGWLICSIPAPSCFIWNDSTPLPDSKYRTILNDYFNVRNGEVMRYFDSATEIEIEFGTKFRNFSRSKIDIDQFGIMYSWFVFTAQKK